MNIASRPKNLKIYKASAGSGKTFTLVKEYIAMLLERGGGERFREILVVTFTNKATSELRERILNELERMTDDRSDMLDQIISDKLTHDPSLKESELRDACRKSAAQCLAEILGDYTSFRIQTIDSFFQEVIRSFVFELGNSTAGAEIELNNTEAIDVSLDRLVRELDHDDPVYQWIRTLYKEALEEGGGYNIQRSAAVAAEKMLYGAAEEFLFLDKDDAWVNQIIDAQKIALKEKIRIIEESLQGIINEIRDAVHYDPDIAKDSYYGFLKRFLASDAKDFIEYFLTKGSPFDSRVVKKMEAGEAFKLPLSMQLSNEEMEALLREFVRILSAEAKDHITAEILLEHLDVIPIIRIIRRKLDEYQKEHNILLISEVDGLMQKIIDGASLPFIYEKVGGRIGNYMIDEFQDTNHTQWENFRPLLNEALDANEDRKDSYLVGDVKQSIYRWRGADSSILNTRVASEFEGRFEVESLEKNWRSDQVIVEFNNEFFDGIYDFTGHTKVRSAMPTNALKEVYVKDVVQEVHRRTSPPKGFVQIVFAGSDTEEDVRNRIYEIIMQAARDGYEPRDIAFLVRDNREAVLIADILAQLAVSVDETDRGIFSFVSSEALLISGALSVQIIEEMLRNIAYHGANASELKLELLIKRFCRIYMPDQEEISEEIIRRFKSVTSEDGTLFELALKGARMLGGIPEHERIHFNAFLDLVTLFSERDTPTLYQFLSWWEKVGNGKYVDMGGAELNSIRILTIHKSKGLEFPIVILPFADWEISKNVGAGIAVCSKEDLEGFTLPGKLPLLDHYIVSALTTPRNLNSRMGDFYRRLFEDNYMDNLNLLYVAFTRAINRLYVIAPSVTDEKKNQYNKVSDIIRIRLASLGKSGDYRVGELTPKKAEEKEKGLIHKRLESVLIEKPLLDEDDIWVTEQYSNPYTERGILLHRAMARSESFADLITELERLHKAQELETSEYQDLVEKAHLHIQGNAIVKDWFTSGTEKKEMCSDLDYRAILCEPIFFDREENRSFRPDRVILDHYQDGRKEAIVIDYKFGEEQKKYRQQLRHYIEQLKKNHYNTRGYIWYELDKVEEVKDIEI